MPDDAFSVVLTNASGVDVAAGSSVVLGATAGTWSKDYNGRYIKCKMLNPATGLFTVKKRGKYSVKFQIVGTYTGTVSTDLTASDLPIITLAGSVSGTLFEVPATLVTDGSTDTGFITFVGTVDLELAKKDVLSLTLTVPSNFDNTLTLTGDPVANIWAVTRFH